MHTPMYTMYCLCTYVRMYVRVYPLSLCVQASSAVFVVLLFQFWYSMNDMQKKTEPEEVCMHTQLLCVVYTPHIHCLSLSPAPQHPQSSMKFCSTYVRTPPACHPSLPTSHSTPSLSSFPLPSALSPSSPLPCSPLLPKLPFTSHCLPPDGSGRDA